MNIKGQNMQKQGNNIFSYREEQMAQLLREKNLDKANEMSAAVRPKVTFYSKYGKRLLDVLIVLPVIIALIPAYLVLAILTFFIHGNPIIYKQTRSGYKGRTFNILKFRSMKDATDKEGRQLPPEDRLTKYGRFIRKYSLDELPNLFNILKGEMSIIGPRAVPIFYYERMTQRHRELLNVRPGLECPRMVAIQSDDEISNYYITFENNIWYVENITLATDIKMVFKLVQMVFKMKERGKHAEAAAFFVGYDDKGRALGMKLAEKKYGNLLQEK